MNKKLIIMIVAGLLVGVGGTAGFFMMRGPAEPAEAPPPPPPAMFAMEPFMVNIPDKGSDRFAKVTLKLAISPGDKAEEIKSDELLQAKMRDRILTVLTSKNVQELVGPIGKEALRREIKANLDPLIEEGEVREVLFSDFVVQ